MGLSDVTCFLNPRVKEKTAESFTPVRGPRFYFCRSGPYPLCFTGTGRLKSGQLTRVGPAGPVVLRFFVPSETFSDLYRDPFFPEFMPVITDVF